MLFRFYRRVILTIVTLHVRFVPQLEITHPSALGKFSKPAKGGHNGGFKDGPILVADKKDGKALATEEGPLRIVVPGEKRQARWTRQLVALKLGIVR